MIVTLDGPAGAGKSTIARELAKRLSLVYLDTGALYRTVALAALRCGIDLGDEENLAAMMEGLALEYREGRIFLGDEDVSEAIRSAQVTDGSSRIAVHPKVRQSLLPLQRRLAAGRAVADGRDMGTVVFPDADLKVYLDASEEERGRRRWAELARKGQPPSLEDVVTQMRVRDARDSGREHAPLRKADDAEYLDTTGCSIQEVVESILAIYRRRTGLSP